LKKFEFKKIYILNNNKMEDFDNENFYIGKDYDLTKNIIKEFINNVIEDSPKELIIGKDFPKEKILHFFPKIFNMNKLRITDVGLYSITKREEAYFITNLITKFFINKKITITDSTACIGGNSISFAMSQNIIKVNSVEKSQLHSDILKNNLQVYCLDNKVEVINDNYLNVCNKLEQDVIYHDFPWGGISYKEKNNMHLYLTDDNGEKYDLINIVNNLKDKCRLQVIKVPINFSFNDFFVNIDYNKIRIHKIFNKYNHKIYYYIIFLIY
jgi:16S rRNA G966 N2-methylase RsmD